MINIGAAISLVLANKGVTVYMVSKNENNLKHLKEEFIKLGVKKELIEYTALDLLNPFFENYYFSGESINKLDFTFQCYWSLKEYAKRINLK
jgi:NADP-dependent 3-hydroxy acid dehydrogenase YdfG